MNSIDPIQLQRLIDGELGVQETQELLRVADSQPDKWRELATAFVEDRVWQNRFVEMNVWVPDSSRSRSASSRETASNKNSHQSNDRISARWWLSLAACMLVTSVLGFAAGQMQNDAGSTGAELADHDHGELGAANEVPQFTQTVYRPDYQLQLEDADGNRFTDSDIPLYDVRHYDQKQAEQLGLTLQPRTISEKVRQKMRNSGYEMKQDVQYVSGRMNDGRKFIVPVRRIEFVSAQ